MKFSFKQIGSLIVSDKDSLATNSKYFNETLSVTRFNFKDEICRRALTLELEENNGEHFPFVFLVERESSLANDVNCKLSIWLDLNDFSGMSYMSRRDFIDFRVTASDNGVRQTHSHKSALAVRVNVRRIHANSSRDSLETSRVVVGAWNQSRQIARLSGNSSDLRAGVRHVSRLGDEISHKQSKYV